jgi:hypothetical protein
MKKVIQVKECLTQQTIFTTEADAVFLLSPYQFLLDGVLFEMFLKGVYIEIIDEHGLTVQGKSEPQDTYSAT